MSTTRLAIMLGACCLLFGCSQPTEKTAESSGATTGSSAATSGDGKTESTGETGGQASASGLKELKIEDVKPGEGEPAENGDLLMVVYTGKLANGTEFDSNDKEGKQPYGVRVGVSSVIQGWHQGLLGAKKGCVRKLSIPAKLGYGEHGQGAIPANSDLYFEIEVLDIVKSAEEGVYDKKVLKPGTGRAAQHGDKLTIRYNESLVNGFMVYDSGGKKTYDFVLGTAQVRKGVDAALIGAQAGSKIWLRLPPAIAYGPQGSSNVQGEQVILYDIEVLKVTPK